MQRRTVKSASRTFEVLELFAEERRPLRLNEIHTALGYPQSSTTNLLKSMVVTGYLNYNRHSRTYLPTPKISALGSWLTGVIYAETGYRRLLEELQRRTDETVGLATQNDLFIQYILFKQPGHGFKRVPAEGTMRLMIDSSSGLALMSGMKDREIEKIYRYTLYYQMADENPPSLDELMREIRWIRQTGYAFHEGRPTPDVSAISMPLGETMHGVPLTIGVGGMADRIARAKTDIVAALREAVATFQASQPAGQASQPAED